MSRLYCFRLSQLVWYTNRSATIRGSRNLLCIGNHRDHSSDAISCAYCSMTISATHSPIFRVCMIDTSSAYRCMIHEPRVDSTLMSWREAWVAGRYWMWFKNTFHLNDGQRPPRYTHSLYACQSSIATSENFIAYQVAAQEEENTWGTKSYL